VVIALYPEPETPRYCDAPDVLDAADVIDDRTSRHVGQTNDRGWVDRDSLVGVGSIVVKRGGTIDDDMVALPVDLDEDTIWVSDHWTRTVVEIDARTSSGPLDQGDSLAIRLNKSTPESLIVRPAGPLPRTSGIRSDSATILVEGQLLGLDAARSIPSQARVPNCLGRSVAAELCFEEETVIRAQLYGVDVCLSRAWVDIRAVPQDGTEPHEFGRVRSDANGLVEVAFVRPGGVSWTDTWIATVSKQSGDTACTGTDTLQFVSGCGMPLSELQAWRQRPMGDSLIGGFENTSAEIGSVAHVAKVLRGRVTRQRDSAGIPGATMRLRHFATLEGESREEGPPEEGSLRRVDVPGGRRPTAVTDSSGAYALPLAPLPGTWVTHITVDIIPPWGKGCDEPGSWTLKLERENTLDVVLDCD